MDHHAVAFDHVKNAIRKIGKHIAPECRLKVARGMGKSRELPPGRSKLLLKLLPAGHTGLPFVAILQINLRTEQDNDFTHGAA